MIPPSTKNVFRVVERKTATLFEAAARIGAVIAGADPATENRVLQITAPRWAKRSRSSTTCSTTAGDSRRNRQASWRRPARRQDDACRSSMRCAVRRHAQRDLIRVRFATAAATFRPDRASRHETGVARVFARTCGETKRAPRALRHPAARLEFRDSLLHLIDLAIRATVASVRQVSTNVPRKPRNTIRIRGVAQPGRVLRSGRRSRRFKSSHPDQAHPESPLRYFLLRRFVGLTAKRRLRVGPRPVDGAASRSSASALNGCPVCGSLGLQIQGLSAVSSASLGASGRYN